MAVKYSYDRKFEGNILVVGQTGCGKTTFIQKLAKNEMFGDLKRYFDIENTTFQRKRKKYIILFSTVCRFQVSSNNR